MSSVVVCVIYSILTVKLHMKILLTVAPFWNDPDEAAPRHIRSCAPLAPYLLCAALKDRGRDARVLDPSSLETMLDNGAYVAEFLKYDAIGISSTSGNWPNARRLIEPFSNMKNRPVIILGGPHPTAFPEHVLSTTPADYVVVGEGEETLPDLVECLANGGPPEKVAGIVFKSGREIRRTPGRELLSPSQLAGIPDPDFSDLPNGYYDVIPVETSRGCPHQCVFCSMKFGRGMREIEPARAAQRVRSAGKWVGRSGKNALFIVDDCFTAGAERVTAVARVVGEDHLNLAIEARVVDILRDDTFEAIRRMNPLKIEIGAECGYPEGLRRMGKGIAISEIDSCAERLKNSGMADRVRFSFVMGLPWEGRKEVARTMKFAAELGARSGGHIQLNWFTCYPRSPIHRDAARWGISINPDDYDQSFWWKDPELFDRTHPKLPTRDAFDSIFYLNLLKKLYPGITLEGLIGKCFT